MTDLLYQTDSYLQTFEAVVVALDQENHGVVLDRTVFYPGGGGQPAVQGTLTIADQTYIVKRVAGVWATVAVPCGMVSPLLSSRPSSRIIT